MDNILEDIENEFQLTNQIKKILQPKGNIAFLDAEFNQKDKQQYELISVAIVICDCNFVEIDKYYSLITPILLKELNPNIIELTGITQKDINENGQDFYYVCEQITNLLKKYDIEKIYTWGWQDKSEFLNKKQMYLKKHNKFKNDYIFKYIYIMHDISKIISQYLFNDLNTNKLFSMKLLSYVMNVDIKQEHHALYDARALKQCIEAIFYQQIDNSKLKIVKAFYDDMNTYNYYIKILNYNKHSQKKKKNIFDVRNNNDFFTEYHSDIYIKAYIDIGIIAGLISADFIPKYYTFEEYVKYKIIRPH